MNELIVSLFEKFPILGTILTLVLAAHGLALAIVAMTPTPKDDGIVKSVYTFVEWLAVNVGKAKDK